MPDGVKARLAVVAGVEVVTALPYSVGETVVDVAVITVRAVRAAVMEPWGMVVMVRLNDGGYCERLEIRLIVGVPSIDMDRVAEVSEGLPVLDISVVGVKEGVEVRLAVIVTALTACDCSSPQSASMRHSNDTVALRVNSDAETAAPSTAATVTLLNVVPQIRENNPAAKQSAMGGGFDNHRIKSDDGNSDVRVGLQQVPMLEVVELPALQLPNAEVIPLPARHTRASTPLLTKGTKPLYDTVPTPLGSIATLPELPVT